MRVYIWSEAIRGKRHWLLRIKVLFPFFPSFRPTCGFTPLLFRALVMLNGFSCCCIGYITSSKLSVVLKGEKEKCGKGCKKFCWLPNFKLCPCGFCLCLYLPRDRFLRDTRSYYEDKKQPLEKWSLQAFSLGQVQGSEKVLQKSERVAHNFLSVFWQPSQEKGRNWVEKPFLGALWK